MSYAYYIITIISTVLRRVHAGSRSILWRSIPEDVTQSEMHPMIPITYPFPNPSYTRN